MAQMQRTRSIWKVNQDCVESSGLIGQYGRDSASMNAVQAIASREQQLAHAECERAARIAYAASHAIRRRCRSRARPGTPRG